MFPDFLVNAALPAFAKTTVEFTPDHSGKFGFACCMNMIHGTLIVAPTNGGGTVTSAAPARPIAVMEKLLFTGVRR